jgi:long-chain-fatty-acid--CoA ligase ACSBG
MPAKSKYWAIEPTGYVEPQVDKSQAEAGKAPLTVTEVFLATKEKYGKSNALALKRAPHGSDAKPEQWKFWTYDEYWADCCKFAKTLIALKADLFSVVNIIGFNSPEWLIANTGAICAGCIAAGIYTTNLPDACKYVSNHSKAQVVVVEDNSQLKKYAEIANDLPHVKAIVIWMSQPDGALVEKITKAAGGKIKVYFWDAFLKLGDGVSDAELQKRLNAPKPGNCSTLIYTSGTTGPPKAVMISHDNITWTTGIMVDCYIPFDNNDRCASYLPLSHIAAQVADIHVPMRVGGCTYFCQPDDMKKGTLTNTLKDVEPTYFFGVPRVWEKIQEKMVQIGRDNSSVLKALSSWAKTLGTKHSDGRQFGRGALSLASTFSSFNRAISIIFFAVLIHNQLAADKLPQFTFLVVDPFFRSVYIGLWSLVVIVFLIYNEGYFLANKLVFTTIKGRLGLHKSKANFTAAAPISTDTLNYFASLDIPVFEVFGQSECTGPHTVSAPGIWKIGACGRPLFGTESKIDKDTKELCYRGRHIFMGYMYDEDKTRETIDEEGFLHSGDVAEFDKDDNDKSVLAGPSGFMKITGRIKELIIGSGGENIPPVLIENEMKAEMVALSNVMVIGDKRKYLTMVVTLKTEVDKDTGAPNDQLAKDALFVAAKIGSSATTVTAAIKCPEWKKYIDAGMKAANARTTSQAQIVQKWALLPRDFSEKMGDLTPTLKLKRSVAAEHFAKEIEAMYKE